MIGVIHGLRHPEQNDANGWYIWCGEYSEDAEFFSHICIEHKNLGVFEPSGGIKIFD